MLTPEKAKRIGIRACMDKIGYDFCKKHKDGACVSWGKYPEGYMHCFLGIDDNIYDYDENPEVLILSNVKGFPYSASCNVWYDDGRIEFLHCEPAA